MKFASLLLFVLTLANLTFAKEIDFKSDLRFRYETVKSQNPGVGKNETYDQLRLRVRSGFEVVTDELMKFDLRLATGTGGTSTNTTLGDSVKGERNLDFKLDRASMEVPIGEGLTSKMGRMANPFQMVGLSDLVFDTDLNFDGISFKKNFLVGESQLGLTGVYSVIDEQKDSQSSSDIKVLSLMLNAKTDIDGMPMQLILAHHAFNEVTGHSSVLTGDFAGNSNNGSVYIAGYELTSIGVDLGFTINSVKTIFYSEFVRNHRADSLGDGWLVGVKYGELQKKGDWWISWDYRELQKDAVLGIIADADSGGGGTDVKSHRVQLLTVISPTLNAGLTWFDGLKSISSTPAFRERLQFDMIAKF